MIKFVAAGLWLCLVTIGAVFFSFQMFVRQSNAQAHVVHFGEVAHSLAESGTNLAWRSIRLRRQRGGHCSGFRSC